MITFCDVVSGTTTVFADVGGRVAAITCVGWSSGRRLGCGISGFTLTWRAGFCVVHLLKSRWKGWGSSRESANYVEPIIEGLIS